MEKTLEQLLQQAPFPPDWVRQVAGVAAAELAALHQQGQVHGRLSADAILVDEAPTGLRVTLVDPLLANDPPLDYRPPEPVGTPLPSDDVFALGVSLYVAAMGNFPPPGDPLDALRNSDLPSDLAQIIYAMLSRDPGQRPENGTELQQFLADTSPQAAAAANGSGINNLVFQDAGLADDDAGYMPDSDGPDLSDLGHGVEVSGPDLERPDFGQPRQDDDDESVIVLTDSHSAPPSGTEYESPSEAQGFGDIQFGATLPWTPDEQSPNFQETLPQDFTGASGPILEEDEEEDEYQFDVPDASSEEADAGSGSASQNAMPTLIQPMEIPDQQALESPEDAPGQAEAYDDADYYEEAPASGGGKTLLLIAIAAAAAVVIGLVVVLHLNSPERKVQPHLQAYHAAVQEGDLDAAQQHIDAALALVPDHPKALQRRDELKDLIAERDAAARIEQLVADARQALDDNQLVIAQSKIAALRHQQPDHRELETLSKRLASQTRQAEAAELREKAQQAFENRQPAEAAALAAQAEATHSTPEGSALQQKISQVQEQVTKAESAANEGRYAAALDAVDQALAAAPATPWLKSLRESYARQQAAAQKQQRETAAALVANARAALTAGDYDRADQYLEQCLELDPGNAEAIRLKGEATQARRAAAERRIEQAQVSLRNGLYDAAIAHAEAALEVDPDNAEAKRIRSEAANEREVRARFEAHLADARAAGDRREWEKAAEAIEAAEAAWQMNTETLQLRGEYARGAAEDAAQAQRIAELDRAQQLYETSLRLKQNPQVAAQLEACREDAAELAAAETSEPDVTTTVSVEDEDEDEGAEGVADEESDPLAGPPPSSAEQARSRAEELVEQERYDEALAILQKAERVEPSPETRARIAEIGTRHGHELAGSGKTEQAQEAFEKAVTAEQDHWPAYYHRGLMHAREDNYRQAVLDFQKVVEIDPTVDLAWVNMGYIYAATRHYEEAVEAYSRAIRMNPRRALTYSNRAAAYLRLREYSEAIEDLNKALSLTPDYKPALINRAVAQRRNGNPGAALLDLNRVLELSPQNVKARMERGALHELAGRAGEARADYQVVLEVDPDHARAQQAVQRLQ